MRRLAAIAAVVLSLGAASPIDSVDDGSGPHAALEALGALIVGIWEADDSRHEHEWGVGRKLIRSRSFFLVDGEWRLVSEGIWFWDDRERAIRSTHLAIDMPVERFEYRTRVEGNTVIHELEAFGSQPGRFVETWRFDADGYRWDLERPTEGGMERVMGGAYRRSS